MINDRNVRPFFLHRFLNNSLRIVLETCVYRSSATSIFPLSQFDDLQARALTMKRSRQVPPSFLFSLMRRNRHFVLHRLLGIFYSLADHSTNVAFRHGWIRHVSWSAITKKKRNLFFVKNPVMVDPSWSRRGKYFRHSSHHRP